MLMNFKNCAEDEECPIPDDVRESMLTFHTALLGHCGKSLSTVSCYNAKLLEREEVWLLHKSFTPRCSY